LAPAKLTIIPDDCSGICRRELETIARAFKNIRLLTVEMAFDFSDSSGIDRAFVLRHGLFGKSQLVEGRHFDDLRHGTRHSATMVREYNKREIGCYRVEIELHSAWLRRFEIETPADLARLPNLLCFKRIKFVEIDWDALSDYFYNKGRSSSALKHPRLQTHSIQQALRALRHGTGLVNVQRFLRPLPLNVAVKEELRRWSARWEGVSKESF
jgi:hypothetical protein